MQLWSKNRMARKRKRATSRVDRPLLTAAAAVAGTPATATTAASTVARPASAASSGDTTARIWRKVQPVAATANGFHCFDADPLDHAETEPRAFAHVQPVLRLLARYHGLKPDQLQVWDPYFCKGAVVAHLVALGFPRVHNQNEDFYARIESGKLPEHHVLVSNPPYSSDNLERCLKFCAGTDKAWMLLLPNWVAKKSSFEQILGVKSKQLCFIAPRKRYKFLMPPDLVHGCSRPDWVGKDGVTSPYDASWYVHLPDTGLHQKCCKSLEDESKQASCEWVLGRSMQAVRWKLKKLGVQQTFGARKLESSKTQSQGQRPDRKSVV